MWMENFSFILVSRQKKILTFNVKPDKTREKQEEKTRGNPLKISIRKTKESGKKPKVKSERVFGKGKSEPSF